MRIVAISDTHGQHWNLDVPDGDLLIHTGDFTRREIHDVFNFNDWLQELPHEYKVVIAGNHEREFETQPRLADHILTNCIYLKDETTIIEGIEIYGTPWQPFFCDWAFNRTEAQLKTFYDKIPDSTQILLTHCPPRGVLDKTGYGENAGSTALLERINQIKPRYHIFGHIHECGGQQRTIDETAHINASVLDGRYILKFRPIIIDI